MSVHLYQGGMEKCIPQATTRQDRLVQFGCLTVPHRRNYPVMTVPSKNNNSNLCNFIIINLPNNIST